MGDYTGNGWTLQEQNWPEAKTVVFARALLRALTSTTTTNGHRLADLAEGLAAAGLPARDPLIQPALRLLMDKGCIANLSPLADGGVVMTVTGLGFDGPLCIVPPEP